MLIEKLKRICEHEQDIYISTYKLEKMRKVKTEVEQVVEKKKTELKEFALKRYSAWDSLEFGLERLESFETRSIIGHVTVFVLLVILTILAQLASMFLALGLFNTGNVVVNLIACAATYYLIVLWLRQGSAYKIMRGNIWKGTNIMYVLAIIINVVIMCSFKFNGTDIATAHMLILFILVAVESIYAIIYCKSKYDEYDDEYYKKKRLICEKKEKIQKAKEDYVLAKSEVISYEEKAEAALSAMQQDIEKQERDIVVLKDRLADLYRNSGLHFKYQNWIATATIYEYLSTRRCDELYGPNGAYNLYEKEVIAKKIISSLDPIGYSVWTSSCSVDRSQSYIRQQLAECNAIIYRITVDKHGL